MLELLAEITAPRFIWKLTQAWVQVKNDVNALSHLWTQQHPVLENFDKDFPTNHGLAVLPCPSLGKAPAMCSLPILNLWHNWHLAPTK